jgi:hypothetical protein
MQKVSDAEPRSQKVERTFGDGLRRRDRTGQSCRNAVNSQRTVVLRCGKVGWIRIPFRDEREK